MHQHQQSQQSSSSKSTSLQQSCRSVSDDSSAAVLTANQGNVSVRNQANLESVNSVSTQKEAKGGGSADANALQSAHETKGRPKQLEYSNGCFQMIL